MPAQDEAALELKLKGHGLWVTEAGLERPKPMPARTAKSRGFFKAGRASRRDLIDFCTLMTFQIRVGVTLVKALEVARQDCVDPVFKRYSAACKAAWNPANTFTKRWPNIPAPLIRTLSTSSAPGK